MSERLKRGFDDIEKRVEKDKRMVFISEQKVSSSCQSRYREQRRVDIESKVLSTQPC